MARREEGAYSREICDRRATKPAAPPRRKTDRNIFKTRSQSLINNLALARPPLTDSLTQTSGLSRRVQKADTYSSSYIKNVFYVYFLPPKFLGNATVGRKASGVRAGYPKVPSYI